MREKIILFSKLNYLLFLILFIVVHSCKTETSHNLDSSDEEKLKERIEELNLAFKECDIQQLKSLITKNYLHTNGNSRVIRREKWIAYLEKRNLEINSGNLVVNTYDMKEVDIEIYDDMAIVTGKIATSFIKSGEHQEIEHRITNIWVKEEGKWKRAGFHDGRIK